MAYRSDTSLENGQDIEQAAQGLTWLGFLAIADPVRQEVPPAVAACHRAGIKVKMVTGDNPDTAQEIARQIGLWEPGDDSEKHLKGPDFQTLSDPEASEASGRLKILSRAKPMEKVRLVRSLQAQGEVVAVTGDGINDCGALNYADVGLAMGRTGKAAAKEASDIILLDDSFRTIIDAVMWGRSLYENIQRFILFQLTINVAALGIAFLGPFIGVELPLTVIQMLWVNLIMDTFAALALATEPPHRDVLNRPPRSPSDFIVTKVMAMNIFGVAALFLVVLLVLLEMMQGDGVTAYELSVFFTVFVLLQFWNLFNARCLGLSHSAFQGLTENRGFLMIAAAIFIGQVLIVQFGGEVFRTVPLSLKDWILITVATSTVLWVGELVRFLRRSKNPEAAVGT
jgi:Ca2+-transporting ATPase